MRAIVKDREGERENESYSKGQGQGERMRETFFIWFCGLAAPPGQFPAGEGLARTEGAPSTLCRGLVREEKLPGWVLGQGPSYIWFFCHLYVPRTDCSVAEQL